MLGFDDVFHAIDEHCQILAFRAQDFLAEYRAGRIEHLAHEAMHEALGDAVAEAAGLDQAALIFEILEPFPGSRFRSGSADRAFLGDSRDQISGTSRLMSWSTRSLGPI